MTEASAATFATTAPVRPAPSARHRRVLAIVAVALVAAIPVANRVFLARAERAVPIEDLDVPEYIPLPPASPHGVAGPDGAAAVWENPAAAASAKSPAPRSDDDPFAPRND